MTSLVDSRPHPSHTPPIDTAPVDNASPFTDINPRAYSPPIKTTTNTVPHATQTAASLPSTPGLNIPGAYPREEVSASKGTSGPSQRQSTPEEKSRTQSYPLTAVPKHLSGAKTSLPSSEKEGIKPGEHYDGVGPLPGSISETSVAKLPDERNESSGGGGGGEPDLSGSVRRSATRPAAASLPSQEKMGVQPYEHYDGVGPLPGTSSETSVAKLPDERKAEERSGVVAVASGGPLAGITNLGTQVRRVDDSESSRDPASARKTPEGDGQEEADVQKVAADSKFKEEVAATEEKRSGPETRGERKVGSIRSAEERRTSEKEEGVKSVPPGESAAAGVPTHRKQRSSSDSDASHHKRASVMNKVKGEMKVLLGKASRNKDKVEEGEKLKHGSD